MSGKKWTIKQLKLLKDNYYNCLCVDNLVSLIGRDKISIYNKAHSLGLKRGCNIGNENLKIHGNKTRFKKGHVSWNKGLKGIDIGGKETQFKKGHLPHNTRSNGEISIRKDKTGREYKYIRISLGKWKLLHRVIWEKEKGIIPDGMIVKFKNGNSLDCDIENLYLCSRSKNMDANTIHRYPSELKKTIRLINKIERYETD